MSNSLFYLLLLAIIIIYWRSVLRRRRHVMAGVPSAVPGAKHGPVPGYAFVPGEAMKWQPNDPLITGLTDVSATSLETLHAGPRSRLVLGLSGGESLEPAESFTLLKQLAQALQRRTRAAVVAVELTIPRDGAGPSALVIYSPDGRGWTGTAKDVHLTADLRGREPFRLE